MNRKATYHAVIAGGIIALGFLFWYATSPGGDEPVSTDALRTAFRNGATPHERALAAAGLGERRDLESMPELLDALRDPSPAVRASAEIAISKILGVRLAFDPQAPPEDQERIIEEYGQLWENWRQELDQQQAPAETT